MCRPIEERPVFAVVVECRGCGGVGERESLLLRFAPPLSLSAEIDLRYE